YGLFASVELDVVTDGAGGEEAVDAAGGDELFGDELIEQLVPLGEELPGLVAVLLVLEDARIDALELPGVEEGGPVDEVAQGAERKIVQHPHPGEGGGGQILAPPLDGRPARPGLLQR